MAHASLQQAKQKREKKYIFEKQLTVQRDSGIYNNGVLGQNETFKKKKR